MLQRQNISIFWWNAGDYYHYDRDKSKLDRWPKSQSQYQAKCAAVDAAFKASFTNFGMPTVVTLGEITAYAAKDLRDRLFPEYNLISLDTKIDSPTLQIAILYRRCHDGLAFSESPPIVVPATPKGTRPMAVLDISNATAHIRCIVCHWQARFDEKNERIRYRMADYLSQQIYDFLHDDAGEKKKRSVIVVGDLNDEPFGESTQDVLNAHRHRARSYKTHWADDDVKRVHLYNCSWRLLGERTPHSPAIVDAFPTAAGTYYWEHKKSWHNLDHFIVSSGLLGKMPPFIDEAEVKVVSLPEFMPEGVPKKFYESEGRFFGLSDHLPIVASISMEENCSGL